MTQQISKVNIHQNDKQMDVDSNEINETFDTSSDSSDEEAEKPS